MNFKPLPTIVRVPGTETCVLNIKLDEDGPVYRGKLDLKTRHCWQTYKWEAIKDSSTWSIKGDGAVLPGGSRGDPEVCPFSSVPPVNLGVKQILADWLEKHLANQPRP